MDTVSRRTFLAAGAAAGGGLILGCRVAEKASGPVAAATTTTTAASGGFTPNAFVRIGTDGAVTLTMPQVEMGQGMYTAIPMLLAEELEVSLDTVKLEHAGASDKLFGNAIFVVQVTGGSTSIRAFHEPMRKAGAAARAMLVAAAADTWKVDPATCIAKAGVVTHTATGRTMTYGSLADAAAKLPVPTTVALKDPKDFTLVGTPVKRLDSREKVNGTAKYGIDTRLPGMKVATVAASPVLGGTVKSVDEAKAKTVKGVHQVVRLDNAVAIIADHMWAAKQGLAAASIQWDDGKNANISTADIVAELAKASAEPGVVARTQGNAAKALARPGAKKFEAVFEAPLLAHATMEPMNCTVHVQKDRCEIWTGTQVSSRAQQTAMAVTGLPAEKVIVNNHLLGGGFGRRLEVDFVTQAVQIAKQVDGPVKVVWTREEDIQHDIFRPYYYDRISAVVDAKGMPTAWSHKLVGPAIIARWLPPAFGKNGVDIDAVDGAEQMVYDIPSIQLDYVRHELTGVNTGFWRGVGSTHNIFVIESFLDELANAAKIDPVAYRRALLGKSPRMKAVLDLAAKESGWGTPLPEGRGRGVSLLFSSWGTYMAQVADVEVTKTGELKVHRVTCAIDCGAIVNPDIVKAQAEGGIMYGVSAALYGQITIKNGRVEQSNFNNYRVLRINEAPAVDVHIVKSTEKPGGMGEPGTSTVFAAISNGIHAVTGKRLRKLPLQSDELKAV